VDVVLHDFVLPTWRSKTPLSAQHGKPRAPTLRRGRDSFVAYCFLRAVLPVAALFALLIVVGTPLLIIFGVLAASASGFS